MAELDEVPQDVDAVTFEVIASTHFMRAVQPHSDDPYRFAISCPAKHETSAGWRRDWQRRRSGRNKSGD